MKIFLGVVWIIYAALAPAAFAKGAPQRVGILLYPGVQIIDFTGPYEVFGWADYEVVTISEDGKPVVANMNFHVTPNYSFANAPKLDVLVIPGGDIRQPKSSRATLQWVQTNAKTAIRVLSVCNGAFILAETGLLDGLSATTFYPEQDNLKKSYPKIHVITDQRLVDNGKIVTAGGLSSGIDAALYIVGEERGLEKARSIASSLEYGWKPEKGYVRGNMADAKLKTISEKIPKNIKFDQIYSYGDEEEWFAAYTFTSQDNTDATTMVNLLSDAFSAAEGWKRQSENTWYVLDSTGKKWILDVVYSVDKKPMELSIHFHL